MLVDHQKQWELLKKSAGLGKIPHAYLFYGEDSVEKKTIALEFIKLINCEDKDFNLRPCQKCRSCRDIEKKIHPDFILIEPRDREIQIAQIRELKVRLSLRSYSAPFKSVIINKAHLLNQEAQSAFLKLLEEPKGKTLFILTTEYPDVLLPTILSRLERLRFYSSSAKTQTDYQKKIIAEISRISRSNLVSRFRYAKELSKEPQNLKEVLDIWLRHFREVLLSCLRQGSGGQIARLEKTLRTIQNTNFLISTTNVNPKLALEALMLDL